MTKGTILVVDDDKDIVKVISIILKEENYIVHTAFSGEEALKTMSQISPDLILMDYMLPDINGDIVATKIRASKNQAAIPMILISAAHNAEKIAQDASFNGYLPKPFEIDKLLTAITQQLSS